MPNFFRKVSSKCFHCEQKAGNGKCDEECNLPECNYDGNDCLVKNPFAGCPNSSFCAVMFKNGVCDEVGFLFFFFFFQLYSMT